MSSNPLKEWAQSTFEKIFEPTTVTESEPKVNSLRAHLDTTFAPNARILKNHEPISRDEFEKWVSESLTNRNGLEWKMGEADAETGVFTGSLVVTRSLGLRVRVAPAQNHAFVTISAKMEGDGDKRQIVDLVCTSVTKAAPIHITGKDE